MFEQKLRGGARIAVAACKVDGKGTVKPHACTCLYLFCFDMEGVLKKLKGNGRKNT